MPASVVISAFLFTRNAQSLFLRVLHDQDNVVVIHVALGASARVVEDIRGRRGSRQGRRRRHRDRKVAFRVDQRPLLGRVVARDHGTRLGNGSGIRSARRGGRSGNAGRNATSLQRLRRRRCRRRRTLLIRVVMLLLLLLLLYLLKRIRSSIACGAIRANSV